MASRYLFVCVLLMLAGNGACSTSKDVEVDDERAAKHKGAKEGASAEAKESGDEGDSGDDDDEEEEAPEKVESEAGDEMEEEEEDGVPEEGAAGGEEDEKPKKTTVGAGAAGVSERLKKAQEALKRAESAIEEVRSQIDDSAGTRAKTELTPKRSGIDFQLVKELAIPIVAFVIGAVLHKSESTAVFGKLAMFFGAQTVMNLYMKEVLSGSVVDEDEGLHGLPCAFIVTALQQMVAFLLFGLVILILQLTPYAYTPKKLTSPMEWFAVVLFSFSFTMNIALNNFSISLLPLSVNLIIRSCLPLATFISQRAASKCTGEPVKDTSVVEIALMLLGVACAAVAVVAKSHAGGAGGGESKTLVFGIIICVASLFSGAINLALAGVLGTSCKLNSLDTTVYMSVPAFLFLVIPSVCYWHPVSWPGYKALSDWEILMVVLERRPFVVGLAAFSGVLALFYNVFQYGIVHSLSASYTAFAGNFNKAATIALGLLVGLEQLPPGKWGIIMALACLGNIAAFTAFNVVKIRAKKGEAQQDSRDLGRDESKELMSKA